MTRPDDSSLNFYDLQAVEGRARQLLSRADAWDRFPVPIDDLLAAANVRMAPTSVFDPVAILSYLRGKATETGARIKSAIAKVIGIYDAAESLIHIDDSVVKSKSKKNFPHAARNSSSRPARAPEDISFFSRLRTNISAGNFRTV